VKGGVGGDAAAKGTPRGTPTPSKGTPSSIRST
jgi:hypothetical protein